MSVWGLVLLEDVEVALGSREQSIVEVVTGSSCSAEGPLLAALSSRLPRQQEQLRNLTLESITCYSKEDAVTLASIIDHIPSEGPGAWNFGLVPGWQQQICVLDEIGDEGWVAIRRAVEHLQSGRLGGFILHCHREDMASGRVADLRAIWNAMSPIAEWRVYSGPGDDCPLCFDKYFLGDEVGWEGGFEEIGGVQRKHYRKGLNAVSEMSEEEWQEELRNVYRLESSSEEDQQVDDEDSGPE